MLALELLLLLLLLAATASTTPALVKAAANAATVLAVPMIATTAPMRVRMVMAPRSTYCPRCERCFESLRMMMATTAIPPLTALKEALVILPEQLSTSRTVRGTPSIIAPTAVVRTMVVTAHRDR